MGGKASCSRKGGDNFILARGAIFGKGVKERPFLRNFGGKVSPSSRKRQILASETGGGGEKVSEGKKKALTQKKT